MGMSYRNTTYGAKEFDNYLFVKNIQGDVLHIYDENGNKVVSYTYDAWGNVTTTLTSGITSGQRTVANNNPFRYRGYYYDTHLEMYYLQSRYYNPEWGRFINADGFVSTGQGIIGNNMFAYCGNNPVTRYDPTGTFWKKFVVVAVVVVAIVVITTGVNHMVNLANEKKIKKEINDEYTEEESIDAIKEISEDISVEFRDNEVVITNAYKVKSRYDRQKISMIISRTGKLDREYDDFSSEWLFHKIAYDLYFMRGNAEPANIEYEKDERFSVRCITNTLEILGWE